MHFQRNQQWSLVVGHQQETTTQTNNSKMPLHRRLAPSGQPATHLTRLQSGSYIKAWEHFSQSCHVHLFRSSIRGRQEEHSMNCLRGWETECHRSATKCEAAKKKERKQTRRKLKNGKLTKSFTIKLKKLLPVFILSLPPRKSCVLASLKGPPLLVTVHGQHQKLQQSLPR